MNYISIFYMVFPISFEIYVVYEIKSFVDICLSLKLNMSYDFVVLRRIFVS